MATLLEISDDLLAFRQLLEDAGEAGDGELTPEAAQALEAWFGELSTNRDAKLDAYCASELPLRKEGQSSLKVRV